jgi:hypothetical protein
VRLLSQVLLNLFSISHPTRRCQSCRRLSPLRCCRRRALPQENSVPQWGAESSLAGQWLPATGGDWALVARTGSGQMRMCGYIFAAARLWRGRLLTTGHLSPRHPVVVGAGGVSWGSRRRGGRKRGRAPGGAMPSACGFSACFQQVICRNVHCEMLSSMAPIALSHGDGAPGAGVEDCITIAHRLWRAELRIRSSCRQTRRRASPTPLFRVDGGGLSVGWIS